MRISQNQLKGIKILLHMAAFLPSIWLLYAIQDGQLSADPAKDIQHFTGKMALKLLLATLLVSPLARYVRQPILVRTRRLLGLWCFAWASLHLASYAVLELGINNLQLLGHELIARPYLTLGIICWFILLVLASTSMTWTQRRLGRYWQTLHNGIYIVAILVPIHYIWSVKILSPLPIVYTGVALALLASRYKKFRQWFRLRS